MSIRRGVGKPFQPGNQHGKGRPPGSRNKAKIAMEALLDGSGEGIMRKAIELAQKGNVTAIRLCLDRYFPPCHERTIHLPLPEIKTAKDVSRALDAVLDAVGQGEITDRLWKAVNFRPKLRFKRQKTLLSGRVGSSSNDAAHGVRCAYFSRSTVPFMRVPQ
jgi:hypothetical protein